MLIQYTAENEYYRQGEFNDAIKNYEKNLSLNRAPGSLFLFEMLILEAEVGNAIWSCENKIIFTGR